MCIQDGFKIDHENDTSYKIFKVKHSNIQIKNWEVKTINSNYQEFFIYDGRPLTVLFS